MQNNIEVDIKNKITKPYHDNFQDNTSYIISPKIDLKGHVGILGGTFNPVHNGHLSLARAALDKFALDRLLIMPNNIPGYKKYDSNISNEHRLEMLRLATEDMDKVTLSDIEIKRSGVTYTVDTLRQLHEIYPDITWHFIMGGDSIMNFMKWREPGNILKLANLIVTTREDISTEAVENKIYDLKAMEPQASIEIMHLPVIDISSSQIRQMVQSGESIYGLTPDPVIEYIQENKLYISNDLY